MWRLSVYLHMFTMYGDFLNISLLHNIKTMQIYTFTHNPVLLLFFHQPYRVSGRYIANRLVNVKTEILINYVLNMGGGNVVSFALVFTLLFRLLRILIIAQSC